MFDRLKAWLSERIAKNRIRRHAQFMIDMHGLHIVGGNSPRTVPWQDIVEILAVRESDFIGPHLTLILGFKDGAVRVAEGDPAWKALTEAIPMYLPESVPYPEWETAFTNPKGLPVRVYGPVKN